MKATRPRSVPTVASGPQYQALDRLATLVAVVDAGGAICWANNALEDAVGLSRRTLAGLPLADWLDRKSTRLNSSHSGESRMPSSA